MKEIKDKQVQSVFGEEEGRAAKSLETLVLLHVVQLAVVIHLVSTHNFNRMSIITIYSFYFSFAIISHITLGPVVPLGPFHFVPPTFAGCDGSNVSSLNNWWYFTSSKWSVSSFSFFAFSSV